MSLLLNAYLPAVSRQLVLVGHSPIQQSDSGSRQQFSLDFLFAAVVAHKQHADYTQKDVHADNIADIEHAI